MGLFSFVKDIGNKLFGGGSAQAAAAPTADALRQEVQQSGLAAQGLDVKVEGGKATVTGNVMSQEEAEKIILSLGNTVGIEQVQSNLLVNQQPAAEPKFYTVKKGDTLWKIAEAQYGKGKGAKYTEIVKANTPPVKNPDLIQPGWVLRIPPLA
jgi:nucleoid-associated protein YgaU